jgi:hypothetical protein
MIMRIATIVTTTVTAALLSTFAFAQSVSYDFDRSANFAKFRTYSWAAGTNVNDTLNHNRIVAAIDQQMALHGFTKVESNPDVLVAYHASFDTNVQITGTGWGGPRFGGLRSATAEEIPVGTLAVDVIDAHAKSIVWRGIATKELDPKAKPEKRDKNINKAAEKLFKNYPPKQ